MTEQQIALIARMITDDPNISEGVAEKYQSKEGGLNDRGRAHYNSQGHNLKKPVTKKQASKSKKSAGRRKSFCSRMGGQKRMHNINCRKNPEKDICKSLKRWDCNESFKSKLDAILDAQFPVNSIDEGIWDTAKDLTSKAGNFLKSAIDIPEKIMAGIKKAYRVMKSTAFLAALIYIGFRFDAIRALFPWLAPVIDRMGGQV